MRQRLRDERERRSRRDRDIQVTALENDCFVNRPRWVALSLTWKDGEGRADAYDMFALRPVNFEGGTGRVKGYEEDRAVAGACVLCWRLT